MNIVPLIFLHELDKLQHARLSVRIHFKDARVFKHLHEFMPHFLTKRLMHVVFPWFGEQLAHPWLVVFDSSRVFQRRFLA